MLIYSDIILICSHCTGFQKYAYGPKKPYDVCAYFDPAYGYAPYHTLGRRGFNQKPMEKNPPFNEVQVHLRTFSVLQFLERLF